MKHLFLHTLLLLTFLSGVQAQRGRVQIQDGTLVTDKGTLLRGAYISTDALSYIPTKDEISGIKELGLNCIHLYAECAAMTGTAGLNYKIVDSIVNMTGRDSLYLVLTIGGCGEEGTYDSAFVNAFWNFYAPRYKDKTHLVYEIMNEPFAWSAPYDSLTLLKERRTYDIIRSKAPDTHVLFMSYSGAINADNAVQDIKMLGDGIDWTKASIAAHTYAVASEELRYFQNTLRDSGYTVTITELGAVENEFVNLACTRVLEQEFVSYLQFIYVPKLVSNSSVFKSPIESSELRWAPDFGTWPASLTEINYRNPYQKTEAGFFDEGLGFELLFLKSILGFINNNDYAAYYNFDFEDGADSLIFECSNGNLQASSGSIELILDSLHGTSIGLYPIPHTESWDDYSTFRFAINTPFEGVHKFYFVFRGDHPWDLMNLRSFTFKKSNIISVRLVDSEDNQKLFFYPNPAKSFIKLYINEKTTIEIFNFQGQILLQKLCSKNDNIIPVNNLSSGSYIIKIANDSKVHPEILIIE